MNVQKVTIICTFSFRCLDHYKSGSGVMVFTNYLLWPSFYNFLIKNKKSYAACIFSNKKVCVQLSLIKIFKKNVMCNTCFLAWIFSKYITKFQLIAFFLKKLKFWDNGWQILIDSVHYYHFGPSHLVDCFILPLQEAMVDYFYLLHSIHHQLMLLKIKLKFSANLLRNIAFKKFSKGNNTLWTTKSDQKLKKCFSK